MNLDDIQSPQDIKGLTPAQLEPIAAQLRERVLQTTLQNGGHLASNLGAVEAVLALHAVFDAPQDQILFDVGHQCYAHKLLTGRRERFDTLRKQEGLSGFPKRNESPYDVFETGHSSTSISAALGMARARDLQGGNYNVVAFIGDGALTGGLALEAMNDAGRSPTRLCVVLNDNAMSISHNVGALSVSLSRIRSRRSYTQFKRDVRSFLGKVPLLGPAFSRMLEKAKNALRYILIRAPFFEEMGFAYIGPVNGHDISALMEAFTQARKFTRPVLVHIVTTKGKGYAPAQLNPERYHVVPEDIRTDIKRFSTSMGAHLLNLAREDDRIVAITAAMTDGCGLAQYARALPGRLYDVGIAEAHATTMAAGMAAQGLKPVVAVYSSFMQRAYDQILHDVCLQNLPVVFALSHCGVVGEDGATHQGIFTLSYLNHMPNMQVLYPANEVQLGQMLRWALSCGGPCAICYPKGYPNDCPAGVFDPLVQRYPRVSGAPDDAVALLCVGPRMLHCAQDAVALLAEQGIRASVVDCGFTKPLSEQALGDVLAGHTLVVTLEDNILAGGFGDQVLHLAAHKRLGARIVCLGHQHGVIAHADVQAQLQASGLAPRQVARRVAEELQWR